MSKLVAVLALVVAACSRRGPPTPAPDRNATPGESASATTHAARLQAPEASAEPAPPEKKEAPAPKAPAETSDEDEVKLEWD